MLALSQDLGHFWLRFVTGDSHKTQGCQRVFKRVYTAAGTPGNDFSLSSGYAPINPGLYTNRKCPTSFCSQNLGGALIR